MVRVVRVTNAIDSIATTYPFGFTAKRRKRKQIGRLQQKVGGVFFSLSLSPLALALRFENPATYITCYYCYNNSGDRLGFEGWQRKSDKNDREGENGAVAGPRRGCTGRRRRKRRATPTGEGQARRGNLDGADKTTPVVTVESSHGNRTLRKPVAPCHTGNDALPRRFSRYSYVRVVMFVR